MSLPDLPANEGLVKFGMPWHGLFVQPMEGQPYVELASGRRITSERFLADRLLSSNTFLFDIGMPEPDMQIEDEDAEFWNKAILTRHGFTSTVFSAWCMTSTNMRAVRTPDGLRYLRFDSLAPPFGSIPARVDAYLYGNPAVGLDYVVVANTGVHDPSKVLSSNHQSVDVLDVTPDGRKWLFSLSYDIALTNYPYRYFIRGQSDDYGLGAIIEVEFSADFKSANTRVVADYNDCQGGRDYTFSDGADLSPGSMTVGDPPTEINYVTGTSVATASKTYVVGGWYSADGALQLVRLRMTHTSTAIRTAPTSRTDMEQYWSGRVDRTDFQAQYKIGDGAFVTVLTALASVETTPMTSTYQNNILSKTFERTRPNAPVDSSFPIFGEISTGTNGQVHQNPTMASATGYTGFEWESYFEFQCDWRESNKVISCMARYRTEAEFEYITSRAATPSGVAGSDASTGNIVPGHDRFAENFDQAKWNNVSTFGMGSYNPVTHQLERQSFGGASFTWV